MNGDKRRQQTMEMLGAAEGPLSGTQIAGTLQVSRQVIVQDIALLRAVNKNILATNKGYVMTAPEVRQDQCQKTFRVCHTDEQIEDELNTIVDLGGKVLDVAVEHDIYGQISADLIISNRRDVREFLRKVADNKTKPLNALTDGVHFHTVEAESEEILEEIRENLAHKGYLLES